MEASMDSGTKVYRGEIYTTGAIEGDAVRYYISEATATVVEVDGVPMVRMGHVLLPAGDFVPTKAEATQQIVDKLRRFNAAVETTITRLSAEVAS